MVSGVTVCQGAWYLLQCQKNNNGRLRYQGDLGACVSASRILPLSSFMVVEVEMTVVSLSGLQRLTVSGTKRSGRLCFQVDDSGVVPQVVLSCRPCSPI